MIKKKWKTTRDIDLPLRIFQKVQVVGQWRTVYSQNTQSVLQLRFGDMIEATSPKLLLRRLVISHLDKE